MVKLTNILSLTKICVYNSNVLVIGATGGNIYDNREGAKQKSKGVRQGKGQGADMIGIMNYSQDGIYDNPSQIDGKYTS